MTCGPCLPAQVLKQDEHQRQPMRNGCTSLALTVGHRLDKRGYQCTVFTDHCAQCCLAGGPGDNTADQVWRGTDLHRRSTFVGKRIV